MTAAQKLQRISVEDYLAGELESETRHEYVAGEVFAMAGSRNLHGLIATNVLAGLHVSLRGKPCRAFNSDTKVRIEYPNHVRFYYPDAMVVCEENPRDETFQDRPVVIVEVLSESTRRTDLQEKRDAYHTIPSLACYVRVEQDMPRVTVDRRGQTGFDTVVHEGFKAVIPLPEIDCELPLAEIYDGVAFE